MFHIDFGDPLTPIILTLSPLPLALGAVRFGAAGFILQSPPLIITLIGMMPPLSILIIGVAATGFCWSIGRYPFTVSERTKLGLGQVVTRICPPLTNSVAQVFIALSQPLPSPVRAAPTLPYGGNRAGVRGETASREYNKFRVHAYACPSHSGLNRSRTRIKLEQARALQRNHCTGTSNIPRV